MTTMLQFFFICHLLGDFYLQTDRLAGKKQKNYRYTLQHCVIYSVPYLIVALLGRTRPLLMAVLLLVTIHAAIDLLKCAAERQGASAKIKRQYIYIADQLLHVATLIGVHFFFNRQLPAVENVVASSVVAMTLFLLVLLKPTNITFKTVFAKYQYVPKLNQISEQLVQPAASDRTVDGAGALIGNMERILMGLLLLLQQYAAIGLILTAKSITRYDKISKDQAFSEYYLIGTLFSVTVTFIAYLVIFSFPWR